MVVTHVDKNGNAITAGELGADNNYQELCYEIARQRGVASPELCEPNYFTTSVSQEEIDRGAARATIN